LLGAAPLPAGPGGGGVPGGGGGGSSCLAGPEPFPGRSPAGMGSDSALAGKAGRTPERGMAAANCCFLPCFTVIIAGMCPRPGGAR